VSASDAVIERLRQNAAHHYLSWLTHRAERWAESPIEEAMFYALAGPCGLTAGTVWHWESCVAGALPGVSELPPYYEGLRSGAVELYQQLPVDGYRLDLAVVGVVTDPVSREEVGRVFVAVECDGHEFHEKTKEQAQHDKARDRRLQELGWLVARFTGSEILRAPEQAAWDVYRLIQAERNRLRTARGLSPLPPHPLLESAP